MTLLGLFIGFSLFISVSADCGQTCALDEVCNPNATACTCNSTAYTNTGGYPSPKIDCNGGALNVFVSKCWLEINGYNSSYITLKDPTCFATREIVNDTAQMVFHQALTNTMCSTTMHLNTTHVTYGNMLYFYGKKIYINANTSISEKSDVIMNFSCTLSLTMSVQLNITLKPVLGTTTINVPGSSSQLTINMAVYKDSSFANLLLDTDSLYVGDIVYISVLIPGLDVSTFKVKVTNLYATPGEAVIPTIDLLTNGCKASGLPPGQISVLSNAVGAEARFALKVFQISGFTTLKLYANVILCTNNCALDCSSQTKSLNSQDNGVTVSVSIYAFDNYDYSSANSLSVTWTLSTLVLSRIFVKLL